jgi:hypothetical protein
MPSGTAVAELLVGPGFEHTRHTLRDLVQTVKLKGEGEGYSFFLIQTPISQYLLDKRFRVCVSAFPLTPFHFTPMLGGEFSTSGINSWYVSPSFNFAGAPSSAACLSYTASAKSTICIMQLMTVGLLSPVA